jgi:16S rRNA processing protein RimM
MNIDECYYLGYTSKVHGKQGELVIKLDVDFPEEYKTLESVLIQLNKTDNSLIPFFISNSQIQNKNELRIKIDDINAIPEAKALVGKEVYLPLNTLPKLTGNKFYYHEVINFKVTDTNLGEIGNITKILDYPTQAIFEITNPQGKEILIPIIDEVIVTVDRENKNVTVTTPEGLVQLYLE